MDSLRTRVARLIVELFDASSAAMSNGGDGIPSRNPRVANAEYGARWREAAGEIGAELRDGNTSRADAREFGLRMIAAAANAGWVDGARMVHDAARENRASATPAAIMHTIGDCCVMIRALPTLIVAADSHRDSARGALCNQFRELAREWFIEIGHSQASAEHHVQDIFRERERA